VWSGVNTCLLTREHCENGTKRIGIENTIQGCHGVWMPEVPQEERCVDADTSHVCGFKCRNTTGLGVGVGVGEGLGLALGAVVAVAAATERACMSYAAPGTCTATKAACEEGCHGEWLPGGDDRKVAEAATYT
jgi:hypothetical protein